MGRLIRSREALEQAYNHMVALLASDPQSEPRLSNESELRTAWYSILAAREALARTVSRVHPSTPAPEMPLPAPRAPFKDSQIAEK